MPNSIKKLEEAFKEGKYDQLLKDIYVDESVLAYQQERYIKALESFEKIYGEKEVEIYSAPGRSEVGGNHTDHQFGKVLATSINLDAIAIVAKRDDDVIDLKSEGYERIIVSLSSFDPAKAEKGTSQALIQGVASKLKEEGYNIGGFEAYVTSDVLNGAGMSSSAALESTYAFALNDLFGENKIDKFELAKVGQATEHNYCGVNCGIMDQFASVFGKKGSLIRLDCRSLEYQYFPFDPQGYRLVLVDSVVKHELASSAYNKRRQSCEAAVAAIQKKHPHVEYLRDCTMEMLQEAKADISEEDFMRAEYVIEEIQRVLDVCDALEKGDYETVGQKMYETHQGMSKLYEVSCEELDFLNDLAFDCGVTGSRVMGGGFGGCTINLVKEELYDTFIEKAKEEFTKKFGRNPKIYDVVISDGARRLE